MKKLSIVIPCYNCEKTINRLLDSIVFSGLQRDQYEVIVCNDKSTDSTLEKIRCYEDKMEILYCTTTRQFHCPGNTRQAALPYISGEWFTFIDNDDEFEPKALSKVIDYINYNNIDTGVICTNFHEYHDHISTKDFIGDNADTWLHGKFYNRKCVLDQFRCHFKDDMFSHEDLYFNSMVLANLRNINQDFIYVDIFTYKWMYNPDSLSRSYYRAKDYYIEEYLEDYIVGASYPFFELFKITTDDEVKGFALNQIIMTILHAYFYYEASIYRLGINNIIETMQPAIRSLKRKIISEIGCNDVDIIAYVYRYPERYHSIKGKCFDGSGPFIEIQSFKDFILTL